MSKIILDFSEINYYVNEAIPSVNDLRLKPAMTHCENKPVCV